MEKQFTFNIKGRPWQIQANTPMVMGILNITPDSFYDASRITSVDEALKKAELMLKEGADILDIGGMSTRPNCDIINDKEEIARIVPCIAAIRKNFPQAILSIDTFRTSVAKAAADAGADIINDVTGGGEPNDESLWKLAAEYNMPYILMHLKGELYTMQNNPQYENVTLEVANYFQEKLNRLQSLGLKDIILDLGFGFGKTVAHNYELMKNLQAFATFNLPILVAISRKSMIYKPLEITPQETLPATTALHLYALEKGANLLRVHDVQAAKQAISLHKHLNS